MIIKKKTMVYGQNDQGRGGEIYDKTTYVGPNWFLAEASKEI